MGAEELDDHLRRWGAVCLRWHPEHRATVRWWLAAGRLVRVLPGTYVAAARAHELAVRVAAAGTQWCPQVVVCGEAAAALTFWPELTPSMVELATGRRQSRDGFRLTRRSIPREMKVWHGPTAVTAPALTALDLAEQTRGDSIDRFLRTRSGRIDDLRDALAHTPDRCGNRARRRLLLESRAEPWSAAERLLHELLHRHRITGWQANRVIRLPGRTCFGDVVFGRSRVVVEVDGGHHHTDFATFVDDRRRQNSLQLHGWLVLRFTWVDLTERPDQVIAEIRRALRPDPAARAR